MRQLMNFRMVVGKHSEIMCKNDDRRQCGFLEGAEFAARTLAAMWSNPRTRKWAWEMLEQLGHEMGLDEESVEKETPR